MLSMPTEPVSSSEQAVQTLPSEAWNFACVRKTASWLAGRTKFWRRIAVLSFVETSFGMKESEVSMISGVSFTWHPPCRGSQFVCQTDGGEAIDEPQEPKARSSPSLER